MTRRQLFIRAGAWIGLTLISGLKSASAASSSLLLMGAGDAGGAVEVGGSVLNEDTGGKIVIEAGGGNIEREY